MCDNISAKPNIKAVEKIDVIAIKNLINKPIVFMLSILMVFFLSLTPKPVKR